MIINESGPTSGYRDISTVYAYYTAEEKEIHGKYCEWWTEFGHPTGTAPYGRGEERKFIEAVEANNPGRFSSYLISWSNCN